MIHMLSAFFLYHIKLRVTLLSRISRYETCQYASSVFVATNTILLVGRTPSPVCIMDDAAVSTLLNQINFVPS